MIPKSNDVLRVKEWFEVDPDKDFIENEAPEEIIDAMASMDWSSELFKDQSFARVGEIDNWFVQCVDVPCDEGGVTYISFYNKATCDVDQTFMIT